MNNTTLQSLISDRDRTSKRLNALTALIEIYAGDLGKAVAGAKKLNGTGKMSAAQKRNISRGVRRANKRKARQRLVAAIGPEPMPPEIPPGVFEQQ